MLRLSSCLKALSKTLPESSLLLWSYMQKEDILTEIRRTAQENNGKPLGVAALRNWAAPMNIHLP